MDAARCCCQPTFWWHAECDVTLWPVGPFELFCALQKTARGPQASLLPIQLVGNIRHACMQRQDCKNGQGPFTSLCMLQVLTGDMLLAAAFVSYAGPFTSKFRALLIADWIRFLREKGAPMTPGITDPLKASYSSLYDHQSQFLQCLEVQG